MAVVVFFKLYFRGRLRRPLPRGGTRGETNVACHIGTSCLWGVARGVGDGRGGG